MTHSKRTKPRQYHKFRAHARKRICERSITHPCEILQRINKEAFVPLGFELNGKRSHELLYLPDDSAWFTIVRDLTNLEIVTFLPVDFHDRCAWKISEEALELSKSIGEQYSDISSTGKHKKSGHALKLIIQAENGGTESVRLGRYRIHHCEILDALRCDSNFRRTILSRIRKKQISLERIRCLVLRELETCYSFCLPLDKWLTVPENNRKNFS